VLGASSVCLEKKSPPIPAVRFAFAEVAWWDINNWEDLRSAI